MDGIGIRQHEVGSATLGNRRCVWVQPPPAGAAQGLLVFLDGEYYVTHVRAIGTVDRLQREGVLPPLLTAYVSHVDHAVRWPETFCNPRFVAFLDDELLPWLDARPAAPRGGDVALAGLSLTGLAAVHAALAGGGRVSRVLSQSGSFWWEGGRLVDEVARGDLPDRRLRVDLSVGDAETDEAVDHGGLLQAESQLASNRRMRDALRTRGHDVAYHEFAGGHATAPWRDDLPRALASLFATRPRRPGSAGAARGA